MDVRSSTLLDAILQPDGLRAVFQPIFELDAAGRHVFSVEGLLHGPQGTNLERTEVLLEYARKKRAECQVDRAGLATVLAAAARLPPDLGVHVNVHAATLCRDPELLNFLGDTATHHGISLPRITLEIIQHAPPWEGRAFQNALDGLRHIGVGVALDDVGLGESNYRMVVECRADYLKLARHIVAGCHADPARRAVLDSMALLARRLGARAIAEGVDSEDDIETLRAAGIRLAQGDLLAPPCPAHAVRDGLSRI